MAQTYIHTYKTQGLNHALIFELLLNVEFNSYAVQQYGKVAQTYTNNTQTTGWPQQCTYFEFQFEMMT